MIVETPRKPKSADSTLRVIVLGNIVRCPLAGRAWADLHYVLGLLSLGHDVYFFEHSWDYERCYDPVRNENVESPGYGLAFADRTFSSLGLGDRWAYHNAPESAWFGPCAEKAQSVCSDADVLLNLGGLCPLRGWLSEIPVRILLDRDPVFCQISHIKRPGRLKYAQDHTHFFTFAENLGRRECLIPDDGLAWIGTRHPVYLPAWPLSEFSENGKFTTVMRWQSGLAGSEDSLEYGGQLYGMKSRSFVDYLDLPQRVGPVLELSVEAPSTTCAMLRDKGWLVRGARDVTLELPHYRQYIASSRAEFSVAKHAYVVSRSGWFSDRSVAYLASGRPVLVQEAGFSDWLATGVGVIAFSDPSEAISGIEEIQRRYEFHAQAAREIAVEYFDSSQVLSNMIDHCT
jgi:hypothetical protein